MTASSGLHNLPADLRSAVAAEPGCVFVRADLGQIEPRVLAAVSGDAALIAATGDDDLYQPVASRLQVTRDVAKVAVLAAMYGATTGTSAQALHGLERAYPTAMAVLEQAAAAGRAGDDVFTIGGRRVRMWVDDSVEGDIDRARARRCRARSIRPQRADPGRGRRVLQGVGGDGAGANGVARRRDRAVPARRVARAVSRGRGDEVVARRASGRWPRRRPGGRRIARCGSSPTSASCSRWSDAKCAPGSHPVLGQQAVALGMASDRVRRIQPFDPCDAIVDTPAWVTSWIGLIGGSERVERRHDQLDAGSAGIGTHGDELVVGRVLHQTGGAREAPHTVGRRFRRSLRSGHEVTRRSEVRAIVRRGRAHSQRDRHGRATVRAGRSRRQR